MTTTTSRRSAAAVGILLLFYTIGLVLVGGPPAGAEPQSNNNYPTTTCGGEWHWVHNQLPEGVSSGTLTAVFSGIGQVEVQSTFNNSILHYNLDLAEGDTLVSASDDVTGGKLLLSHYPDCETTTTAGETTTTVGETTLTTGETTTTAGESTTSSVGVGNSVVTTSTTATSEPAGSAATVVSVLGTVIESSTTIAAVSASTLPFTGFELETTLLLALAAVMTGVGLLLLAYGTEKPAKVSRLPGRW